MFDRWRVRLWLALVLLAVYALTWAILQSSLNPESIAREIDSLECSVTNSNWSQADKAITKVEAIWKKTKLAVQTSNGSEEVIFFENTLEQVKTLVKHQKDDVLGHIGSLRAAAKSIMNVFPGP